MANAFAKQLPKGSHEEYREDCLLENWGKGGNVKY